MYSRKWTQNTPVEAVWSEMPLVLHIANHFLSDQDMNIFERKETGNHRPIPKGFYHQRD